MSCNQTDGNHLYVDAPIISLFWSLTFQSTRPTVYCFTFRHILTTQYPPLVHTCVTGNSLRYLVVELQTREERTDRQANRRNAISTRASSGTIVSEFNTTLTAVKPQRTCQQRVVFTQRRARLWAVVASSPWRGRPPLSTPPSRCCRLVRSDLGRRRFAPVLAHGTPRTYTTRVRSRLVRCIGTARARDSTASGNLRRRSSRIRVYAVAV